MGNTFSKKEIKWLKKAIDNSNTYCIKVDNDCVFIGRRYDDGYGQWDEDCAFTFDDYGQDFIVKLLNYIGCNADYV